MEPARAAARADRAHVARAAARGGGDRGTHAWCCRRTLAAPAGAVLGSRAAAQIRWRAARRADRARGGAVRGRLIAGSLAVVAVTLSGGSAAAGGASEAAA